MLRRWALTLWTCLSIFAAQSALAWGHEGHSAVGALADQQLTPAAAAQVAQLAGMPLRDAARWADCVRDVAIVNGQPDYQPKEQYRRACKMFDNPVGIERMKSYVMRNYSNCKTPGEVCHKQYHYTNLNYLHNDYAGYAGTSDNDIVHAIHAAVAVLRDQTPLPPFNGVNGVAPLDKTDALYLLAHLVGDLHQPLHVASLYLDGAGHPIDPDHGSFDPKSTTRGGNSLTFGDSNLHADWDTVSDSIQLQPPSAADPNGAGKAAQSAGPASGWPEAWAADTLQSSTMAFAAQRWSARTPGGVWMVSFDDRDHYQCAQRALQRRQLIKAGNRLAQLLNDIWP